MLLSRARCVALVAENSRDAPWRRLLFIGPGQFTDRELDGVLQLEESECNDPAYVDPAKGVTVAKYVNERFGISRIYDAHAIMVVHKRRSETHLV